MLKSVKSFLSQDNVVASHVRQGPALQLIEIREGIEPVVIIINGFLSKNAESVSDWLSVVNELYPKNRVIHAKWDAGDLPSMARDDGLVEGHDKLLPKLQGKSALVKALAGTAIVANKITGHWKKAFHETKQVGTELALALETDKSLHDAILMGHSLGARVVRHALFELEKPTVSAAYLLAGAVSADQSEWQEIFINHSNTTFVNCMSQNDSVLKNAYKFGCLFDHQPAGLTPLYQEPNVNLHNFDVTEYAAGHTDFKTQSLGTFLKNQLSK